MLQAFLMIGKVCHQLGFIFHLFFLFLKELFSKYSFHKSRVNKLTSLLTTCTDFAKLKQEGGLKVCVYVHTCVCVCVCIRQMSCFPHCSHSEGEEMPPYIAKILSGYQPNTFCI